MECALRIGISGRGPPRLPATVLFACVLLPVGAALAEPTAEQRSPLRATTDPAAITERLKPALRVRAGSGFKPRDVTVPRQDPALVNPFAVGPVLGVEQVNHFVTGFDEMDNPLPIPSIDPAGIVYYAPGGGLVLADSEITEVAEAFNVVGATHFLVPTVGGLTLLQWDLSQITGVEPSPNLESTGIAYCENDAHFYVTNDDTDLLYRYQFDGTGFSVVDFVSVASQTNDPEGVTCDPATGNIYVIGGIEANIVVYTYQGGFVFQEELELDETAGNEEGELDDAEGIAFDPVTQHLFVVSDPAERIVEYDLAGRYIQHFDLGGLSPAPIAPQGLTIGPATVDSDKQSFFISDGGLDNDQVPSERDGAVYELLIVR